MNNTKKIYFFFPLFFCILMLSNCSSVFTASIDGRIIDKEAIEENNTVGVANATVWLYTSKGGRDNDYEAWVEGDRSSLPDAVGRSSYRYYLATNTDNNGNYQFAGIIWEKINPEFGKTADKTEVWLLIYHPDYGLSKNPAPLFLVSDVTNQFSAITIEDIWSEATISGKTLNWQDGKALGNVPVRARLPKSWTYTEEDVDTEEAVWKDGNSYTTTSNAEGAWSLKVRFAKQKGHVGDKIHRALARVSWERQDWRAGNPAEGATHLNSEIGGDIDLNVDGRTAMQGDAFDWFYETQSFAPEDIVETPDVVLQRWKFSANLSGTIENTAGDKLNGLEIVLFAGQAPDGVELGRCSSVAEDTAQATVDGRFNFERIDWDFEDLENDEAVQKTGALKVYIEVHKEDASPYSLESGNISSLLPDANRSLRLVVQE